MPFLVRGGAGIGTRTIPSSTPYFSVDGLENILSPINRSTTCICQVYATSKVSALLWFWVQIYVILASTRNFVGAIVAVGPAGDPINFNPDSLQYICTTITEPFSFPETREIWCNRYLLFLLYFAAGRTWIFQSRLELIFKD